jgi:ubiquinone/menaquinone biosynthesis C-methylase UbiE
LNDEQHFRRFLESTANPDTPREVVLAWWQHEFESVQRGRQIVDQLAQHTLLAGKRILDLGCGCGGISIALKSADANVVGLDISSQQLAAALVRTVYDYEYEITFVQAGAERLPFSEGYFDFIVCNDVLEHVKSRGATLSEISRILKPGGFVYLQFPNRLSMGNLRKDPHYGLFGVSILPPSIASWYVTKLLRRSATYKVEIFPIASCVARKLDRLDVEILDWWPAPQRRGFLMPLVRWYRFNTRPLISLLGRKIA